MTELQKEFNEEAKDPIAFGEDGDLYVLSLDYTYEQAIERFMDYWEETAGEDEPKPDLNVGVTNLDRITDGWKIRGEEYGQVEGWLLELI